MAPLTTGRRRNGGSSRCDAVPKKLFKKKKPSRKNSVNAIYRTRPGPTRKAAEKMSIFMFSKRKKNTNVENRIESIESIKENGSFDSIFKKKKIKSPLNTPLPPPHPFPFFFGGGGGKPRPHRLLDCNEELDWPLQKMGGGRGLGYGWVVGGTMMLQLKIKKNQSQEKMAANWVGQQ